MDQLLLEECRAVVGSSMPEARRSSKRLQQIFSSVVGWERGLVRLRLVVHNSTICHFVFKYFLFIHMSVPVCPTVCVCVLCVFSPVNWLRYLHLNWFVRRRRRRVLNFSARQNEESFTFTFTFTLIFTLTFTFTCCCCCCCWMLLLLLLLTVAFSHLPSSNKSWGRC